MTTTADRAAVAPSRQAGPGVTQLAPLHQTTFPVRAGWVRRFGILASDAEYVYVPHDHGGQGSGHENESPAQGELVVLRRDGLAEHRRVQVGWLPSRVVIDTRNERVYVVNYGQQSYSVSVLDRVKLLGGDPAPLIGEAVLKQAPIDVAVDQRRNLAYVTSTFQKKLQVVDGATGAERAGEAVTFADGPIGVAYDEGTDMIYVVVGAGVGPADTSTVVALDAATRQVQATALINPADARNRLVTVLPAEAPRYIPAQEATRQQVWVSRLGGGPGGPGPGAAVVEFDFGGGHANTGSLRHTVALHGAVGVVAADRHQRQVHATGGSRLTVIDTATRAAVAEHQFTDSAGQPVAVHALDVSPADSRIYVAGGNNGTVYEFDPQLWPDVRPRAPLGAELGVAKANADQNLYVFVAGEDQVMRMARHTDALPDQEWSDWVDLPGGTFPLRAPVAVVAPSQGRWRAFAVDTAGRLLTVGGTDTTPDGPWAPLPGQEARGFPPRAHVTAITWAADQWIVFAIDSTGEVYSAGTSGGGPIGWITLPGETFAPGAPLVAVSRKANHWDLVAFHPDGRMRTIWKGTKGGIQPWGAIGQADLVFRPGTRITMVGRNDRQLDVFAVGPDGDLWTIFWSGGWSAWGSLGGQFSHEHQVGATGRNEDALDVAAFDHDGQLLVRWWGHDEGWNPQWEARGTPRWGVVEPTVALLDNISGPSVPWLHAIWPSVDGSVHHAWWTKFSGRWSLEHDIDHVIPTPTVRRGQHMSGNEFDADLFGDVEVQLWSDGTYATYGRVHDTGVDPYDYAVQVTARSNVGQFALTRATSTGTSRPAVTTTTSGAISASTA
jgi:DNA-binding beta-propeller fold protein YncE